MPEELFNVLLLNLDFKEKQVENVFFNNSQGSFDLFSPIHYTVFLLIFLCSPIFFLFFSFHCRKKTNITVPVK
jgi:hypothetical protein